MSFAHGSVVKAVATGLKRTGLLRPLSISAGYARRGVTFAILTYHRVNDERCPFAPSLPTSVFEEQMRFVAGAYVVLPVEELVQRVARGTVPRNALAITFDDGYHDNLTHAAPVLARYGLPATIFLATGSIGTGDVPWFERVAQTLKHTVATAWNSPWGELLPLTRTEERVGALEQIVGRLKGLPEKGRRRTVDEVLSALGAPDDGHFKKWMLNWEDVQALSGLGFSIGAHTISHPILSRVGIDEARCEIFGSRAAITEACGRAPVAFAYPNGKEADYTPAVVEMVRQAGFTCAVTTRFGVNNRDTSRFELRRGGPWEHHLPTFALKLAGYRVAGA